MNVIGIFSRLTPLVLLLCVGNLVFSQLAKPGLLWRISGNGLEKPSYLFGTIHLTDKRVFNFGDSLYSALEASSGYAMELNPDSLMVRYFKDQVEEKESPLLKSVVSADKFSAAKKKLEKEFGKAAEKITIKDLKSYFNEWFYRANGKSMQSFMDAYLYNIVRRQGKWVGGIEDVEDQLGLNDDESDIANANYYLTDFMNNKRDSKRYLEDLISRYTSNDLSLIEEMSDAGSQYHKDVVLLKRNIKMAHRIDSLSKVRNTFFAIGSAHLPGDSGVISLLRMKGYTLTPVVSSKLIHAEDYKFDVHELPWVKVKSTTGLYIVEMPGEPQAGLLEQDEIDFKMYADVPTNLYYFTMGVIGKSYSNIDSAMRALVANFDKKAVISGLKNIRQDSIDGMECFAKSDNLFYHIKLFYKAPALYLAMVGSTNTGSPLAPEAEKFFHSFVMNPHPVQVPKGITEVDRRELGFRIQFPLKPGIKKPAVGDDGWITHHYTGIDFNRDIFYQCMIKDSEKGYYQSSDSIAFEVYRTKISETYTVPSFKHLTFQNYPAVEAELLLDAQGTTYYNKLLNVHRGNRMYVLLVTTSQKDQNQQAIDSFLNSFQLTEVRNPSWSQQTSPDGSFRTWSCSPIEPYSFKEEDSDGLPYWIVYDSLAPVTFFIRKEAYPKFFWAKDDTSLLRSTSKNMVGFADSLLSYQLVQNGKSRSAEILVRMYDNHNLKKMRMLLAGDTLYTLYAIAPTEVLNKPDYRRVFDDFRLVKEPGTSTLYVNKRRELMRALHANDSATRAQATTSLNTVNFGKEDLPDLHRAMLETYADSGQYYTISRSLFQIVQKLDDPSTIQAVRDNYRKLPAGKEELKYPMLFLLAKSTNPEAPDLLGELLSAGLPQAGMPYEFFNALNDSLPLAKRYYPLLFKYLGDTMAMGNILRLAEDLIDSSLVDVSLVREHKKIFFDEAMDMIKKRGAIANDDYSHYLEDRSLINLLGKMQLPDANALLRKISLQKNINLKYYAVVALLENMEAVEPALLSQLAATTDWRLELYNELKKLNKQSLFPKQYFTQQYFGEAEMFSSGYDDGEVTKVTYLGERTANFKSVKSKFLLFKVEVSYDGEKSSYLGVVGPYKLTSKTPDTGLDATGLYWEEPYNSKDLYNQLKKFLAQWEKE